MSAQEIGALRASASLDTASFEAGAKKARSALRNLGVGFEETTREALRQAEGMARAYDTSFKKTASAAQRQIDALVGLDRAGNAASATSKRWANQLDMQAKSFDRLRSSIDPVFAASKQYEVVTTQVESAVRAGIVSQAEANKVLEQAAQKYLGLVPAAEQAAKAQAEANAAATSARSAYDQTRASLDPLFASSKRYEAVQEQMASAVRLGAVTQAEANKVLRLAEKQYLGVSAATGAATAPTRGFFSLFSKERSHDLRNISLQLNQIAQQGSVTGDYLGAAAVQAADIGSALGVAGIAAGALISVIGPIAFGMLGLGKEAEKFSDRVDDLSAAVSDYKNYADLAASSTDDLRERFGAAGERAGEIAEFMQEFSRVDSVEKLDVAVSELTERFGGLGEQLVAIDDTRGFWASLFDNQALGLVKEYRNTMLVLQRELGITEVQAKAVVTSLARLGAAEGPEQAVEASAFLHEQFLAIFGTVEKIPKELREVARQAGIITLQGGEILTLEQRGANEIARRVAASAELVASYTDQAAMANAIASYGADSAQVEALKRDAALKAAEAMIEQENLSGLTAERVRDAAMAAFDAEVNSAAAAESLRNAEAAARGLASAIAAAAGYSASLDDGVRVLQAEVDALRSGADGAVAANLEAKRLRAENLRDASVAAGQLAVIADAQLAIDLAAIDAQGQLIVEKNKLTDANRRSASAGSKAANAAEKSAKALAEELKALKASLDPIEAYNQQLEELAQFQGLISEDQMAKAMRELNVEFADSLPLVGDLTDALVDGLFNGFSDGLDGMLNAFKGWLQQMIATALKNQIVVSLGLGAPATVGGVAQAAGGGLGLLGGAGNLLGLGGSAGLLAGLSGGAAATLGLGGYASAGFFNIGANAAAASAATGAGAFASTLGAALPVLGAVALAVGFFRKKVVELDSGLRVTVDGMDALVESFSHIQTSRFWGLSKKRSTNYTTLDDEAAAPIQASIDAIGEAVVGFADTLGLASDNIANVAYQFQVSTKGLSDAEIQEALTREFDLLADEFAGAIVGTFTETNIADGAAAIIQSQIDAIPARLNANDLDRWDQQYSGKLAALNSQLQAVLSGTVDAGSEFVETIEHINPEFAALQKEGEGAYDTLERLATSLGSFNSVADMLNLSLMDASLASGAAAASIVELAGGFDQFSASSQTYFSAFYSEQEQYRELLQQTRRALRDVGVALPTTRDGFRDLVEAQDLTSEAGQRAFAALMNLSGAADQIYDWREQPRAGGAADTGADTQERYNLRTQILTLMGNEDRLRARALLQLDEGNRALQERIWHLEDEAAAEAAAAAIQRERSGLRTQILQLQGNTARLRERELAQLDPANRALQERIWRLQDAAEADALAARAAEEAAQVAAGILNERQNLEAQLWQLQGRTDLLRARELSGLDASNRALQENIWALEDQAAAAEAAAAAQRSLWDALVNDVSSAMSAVSDAVGSRMDRVRDSAQEQLDRLSGDLDAATSRASAARSAISGFIGDIENDTVGSFRRMRDAIAQALETGLDHSAIAGAEAYRSAQTDILRFAAGQSFTEDQLNSAISGLGERRIENYTDLVSYARDAAVTNQALRAIQGKTEDSLTEAEKQVVALRALYDLQEEVFPDIEAAVSALNIESAKAQQIEQQIATLEGWRDKQLEALDAQLAAAQAQADAALGIGNGLLSIADAVAGLQTAIGSLGSVSSGMTRNQTRNQAIAAASGDRTALWDYEQRILGTNRADLKQWEQKVFDDLKVKGFSGGGFTGWGSRSGGLDGEGGFLAMLHPRETVVDHHRGQSIGGADLREMRAIRAATEAMHRDMMVALAKIAEHADRTSENTERAVRVGVKAL